MFDPALPRIGSMARRRNETLHRTRGKIGFKLRAPGARTPGTFPPLLRRRRSLRAEAARSGAVGHGLAAASRPLSTEEANEISMNQ